MTSAPSAQPETLDPSGEPDAPAPEPVSASHPTPHEGTSMWSALKYPHFRRVWCAALVSSIGTWMEFIGVQWAMSQAALEPEWINAGKPKAEVMMGYLAAAQMGPTLVLGIVGGVAADVIDRKKLLVVTQFMLMAVAVALAVLAHAKLITPIALMLLGGINGIIMAFNIPAWQVLTPRLVPKHELAHAVTLNGLQFNIARVIGPAVGGMLMGWFGVRALFDVNAISFIAVIVAVLFTPPAPRQQHESSHPWTLVAEAFRYLFTHKSTLVLIAIISLFSLLGTPMLRFLPILVSKVYHKEEAAYGTMMALLGVGAVAGGFLLRRVPHWYPRHHLVPLTLALAGFAITTFSLMDSMPFAALGMLLVGITWIACFSSAFAALQLLLEDRVRGRVLSICNVISFGCMPLGTLLASGSAELVSSEHEPGLNAQRGLTMCGVALAIIGLCLLTWRTPAIDAHSPGMIVPKRRAGLIRGITASAHRPQRSAGQSSGQPARRTTTQP